MFFADCPRILSEDFPMFLSVMSAGTSVTILKGFLGRLRSPRTSKETSVRIFQGFLGSPRFPRNSKVS